MMARNCATGSLKGDNLWDLAGAFPIYYALGLREINMKTKEPIEMISQDLFNKHWQLKEPHILCHPDDFDDLMSIIDKTVLADIVQ